MGGDESCELGERSALTVDDEGHEQQSKRQVLGVEVYNEEADLTRRVVLSERVRVCEGQRGEERVAIENDTCKRLSSPSAPLLSSKREHSSSSEKKTGSM